MSKHILHAQNGIAQQLAELGEDSVFSKSRLQKIALASVMAISVAVSASAPTPAHAADAQTYSTLIGGSIGALVGARVSRHMPSLERTAVVVATGAAGAWAGDTVGQGIDQNRRNEQAARREPVMVERQGEWITQPATTVVVRQVQPQPQQRYVDDRSSYVSRENTSIRNPENSTDIKVYDAATFDMPVGVVDLLRKSGNKGMVLGGSKPLEEFPLGEKKLKEVTDSFVRGARVYIFAENLWENAQLSVGPQGVAEQARASEQLLSATKLMQSKAVEWVGVRNILAGKGFDVSGSDEAIKSEMSHMKPVAKFGNTVNTRFTP